MNLPEGITLIEQQTGKINLINEEFKRIFGVKSGECLEEKDLLTIENVRHLN